MRSSLVPNDSARPAWRLALVYSALFLWMGVYLPYWPVWLTDRGMSPSEIGILLGVAPWTRLIASPVAGRWADRQGIPHRLVQGLALLLMVSATAFELASGFWTLLLLMVVVGLVFSPIVPLVDGITLSAEAEGRLSYGPVRLWGSVAFIGASWVGGELLEREGEAVVLWLLVGSAGLLALGSWLLPRPTTEPNAAPVPGPGRVSLEAAPAPWLLPRSWAFVAFLLTVGLLHLSHAVLYAFGTEHWRAQGLDEGTVGLLWAESVLSEILLFAIAPRISRALSPRLLWIAAGLAGALRWTVLGATVALPWLVLMQALHGLTFGALHLGAMNHLRLNVPAHARGLATTWYSAAGAGLALGIGLPLAGVLYAEVSGQAYWAMALCSGLGMLLALVLPSRPPKPLSAGRAGT